MGIYDRQNLAGVNVPDRVIVAGVGGVGCWVAIWSAMAGVKEIVLCDHDVVEMHNLARMPLTTEDVGRPKTEAIKDLIQSLRPETCVVCMGKVDEGLINILSSTYSGYERTFFVDCTDRVSVQQMIASNLPDHIRYIRAGCDADSATVVGREETLSTFVVDPDHPGGYIETPSYVGPAALAASIVMVQMLGKTVSLLSLRGGIRIG